MELLGSSEISLVLNGYSTTPAIPVPGYELYIFYGETGEDISRSFELGHPGNEFEAYRMLFSNRQQDFGYTFNYFGTELPDNLIVPQRPLFNVDNPEIKGFEISTDLDYKRKEIRWSNLEPRSFGNNRRIEWKVFSSFTSSSVIGDIPEEILNGYPDMDVSGLTYEYSYLHVGPYSQNEFLEAKFRGEDYEILFSNLEFFYFYPQ
ncbi:hypothetical protein [Ulvibacterium sp.]|uniref:hypothetical protein n=1 Tax=Ulvibacterium sp. TaxID=2665914 RepID=UPI003CC5D404